MTHTAGENARAADTPLEALRPWPRNPRRITPARLEQLKRALEAEPEMLAARPLIALPDGTVIAGNQRLRAARELGWASLPVVTVDLDEARAAEWALRDNRGYGEDDEQAVGELLAELSAGDRPLDLSGYGPADIDRILAAVRPTPLVDPDLVPDLPADPRSVRGEVYELGPHRLMCGDACEEADVRACVASCGPVALMVTDPPYGVSVNHTWRDGLRQPIGAARTGLVPGDQTFDWEAAYRLTDAPVAYVWHSALHAGEAKRGLAAAGFEVRQQIIWVKDVHALGRSAYHWKHETCWYAVRKGATSRWTGGRLQTTVWEAPSPIMAYGGGQDDARTPHPTQKPLAVTEPPIANHTVRGDFVYDPFAGSGTTLIACEQLGRRCIAVEIDPGYCDVIRQRYADFTNRPELAP